jgi:hypothetical protein
MDFSTPEKWQDGKLEITQNENINQLAASTANSPYGQYSIRRGTVLDSNGSR